jgi:hypothetical protein
MDKAKEAVSSFIGRAGHHDTARQTSYHHKTNFIADVVIDRYREVKVQKQLSPLLILTSAKVLLLASQRRRSSPLAMKTVQPHSFLKTFSVTHHFLVQETVDR